LDENTTRGVMEYVANHPALMFLIAMPDDDAIRVLMDKASTGGENRLPIPLVLIENRPVVQETQQDAA